MCKLKARAKAHLNAEKPRAKSTKNPKRWHRHYYAIPRITRLLIFIIAFLLIGHALTRQLQHRRDFALKQLPTDFTALGQRTQAALWQPEKPVRHINGTPIDERYMYMCYLGKGREGSAALYVDTTTGEVVIVQTLPIGTGRW